MTGGTGHHLGLLPFSPEFTPSSTFGPLHSTLSFGWTPFKFCVGVVF